MTSAQLMGFAGGTTKILSTFPGPGTPSPHSPPAHLGEALDPGPRPHGPRSCPGTENTGQRGPVGGASVLCGATCRVLRGHLSPPPCPIWIPAAHAYGTPRIRYVEEAGQAPAGSSTPHKGFPRRLHLKKRAHGGTMFHAGSPLAREAAADSGGAKDPAATPGSSQEPGHWQHLRPSMNVNQACRGAKDHACTVPPGCQASSPGHCSRSSENKKPSPRAGGAALSRSPVGHDQWPAGGPTVSPVPELRTGDRKQQSGKVEARGLRVSPGLEAGLPPQQLSTGWELDQGQGYTSWKEALGFCGAK